MTQDTLIRFVYETIENPQKRTAIVPDDPYCWRGAKTHALVPFARNLSAPAASFLR